MQAEDGIREVGVTGVQTCALRIWSSCWAEEPTTWAWTPLAGMTVSRVSSTRSLVASDVGEPFGTTLMSAAVPSSDTCGARSEERRVGKECRSRWSPYH